VFQYSQEIKSLQLALWVNLIINTIFIWNNPNKNNLCKDYIKVIYKGYIQRLYTKVIYKGYIQRLYTKVIYKGYIKVIYKGYIQRLYTKVIYKGYI
jgi:hypothetical protein